MNIKQMNDLYKLVLSFIIILIIAQLVFYNEAFFTVSRTVASLFWLFVLPGFGFTYLWKFRFLERLALSVGLSVALVGVFSYYLGLVGLHIATSSVILPIIFLIIGFGLSFFRKTR